MACGFCESALSNSVGTLIVDCVVKPVGRQLDYVRRFHDNVEKLMERKDELTRARARLQHEIEGAERQLLRIEDDVLDLQSKADETLSDVETLGKEIQQNKRCLKWCPNWSWRYRLSKKAMKKTMNISELLEKINKFGQPGRVGYRATSILPTIEFLCSKEFVVSKSSEIAFKQIIEALQDENISMIGLWGMGGVGKTTLVREVGNQAQKQNLFDKVVFTTVSKKPNFESIQDQIAQYIGFDMKTVQGRRSEQDLWLRLKNEPRILIILDDVWTHINLKEKIGIPVGEDHKGCKVLLTTRRQQVCHAMDCRKVVPLDCLDDDEAWTLFAMKAGLNDSSDDAIKKVATQIIKKCQGLPIAIVPLGSALKGKSYNEWKAAYRRLKDRRLTEIEDVNEENAYLCLEASFDYLKDKETKTCFLLCSLFPEDYEIYMEDLVRYAWGLELHKGIDSIEEVRSEVLASIEILKSSCLLLSCGGRHVKMHDMVREFALWIASSGRKEIPLVITSEVVETLWMDEGFKRYTAISIKTNRTVELPDGLVFPNLKILLLGGIGYIRSETSSEFFEGMKALQVCALDGFKYPAAFQFQTKLRTLHLNNCALSADISMLGKLKTLEILSLSLSYIIELPNQIGDLENLRLLDLSYCKDLQGFPPNLIVRLSNLEELYLHGCSSMTWAAENTTEDESYSSLSELDLLPNLVVLSLDISSEQLPDGFVFRKLRSFDVCIGIRRETRGVKRSFETCPIPRCLKIAKSVDACTQLFEEVESLELSYLVGHCNLVPSLEFGRSGAFSSLTSLYLLRCESMKCLIDASQSTNAFSNLVNLSLRDMLGFEELYCNGPHPPQGFLQNLKTLSMSNCEAMVGAIPITQNLEELKVEECDKMQVLFQIAELSHNLSLKSLKVVEITRCNNLRYIFPKSVADSLVQLETLRIVCCSELEEIIQPTTQVSNISLQSLKVVEINRCKKLRYLFPVSVANSLGQLQTLRIIWCPELEEIIQATTRMSNISLQNLKEIYVSFCNKLTSLSSLSHGHKLESLSTLSIRDCLQFEYTFPISMAEGLPLLNEVELRSLPQLKERDAVLTQPSLHKLTVDNSLLPLIISAKIHELVFWTGEERKIVPQLRGESSSAATRMECLTISNDEYLFDSGYNLSNLKMLQLWYLLELRVIWNGPIRIENFQNLTEINVQGCMKLRYIFSPTIARNLPQLSCLEVSNCEDLEQIIENDDHHQTLSQDLHLQSICFPNITHVVIKECENLRSLFPVTVAHGGLPKLKSLHLGTISKLEQVFEGDEANVTEDEERVIHLPQVDFLYFSGLPNLTSFSPVGYHFVFPSVQTLNVRGCPNMITSFSVDSNRYVHAKTQARQSVDESIVEESATAHVTTWPIGSDIWLANW